MSKSKQATLFQSWGQKKKEPCENKNVASSSRADNNDDDVIDLCLDEDEDDDLLAQALEESILDPADQRPSDGEVDFHTTNQTNVAVPGTSTDHDEHIGNISIGADTFSSTQGASQTNAPEGFDKSAGKLWIYPTNYPVRDYQFNIVKQSLFHNTMVTLPTGLGKTFIASVVMYNFYRWYPLGKVIFMAPTKPLVAQQIEACYNIMGIPQADTAEMTGNMPPQERRKAWQEKRVFFLTPQVLTNDLSRGTCPAMLMKCLVVDEAHKALGNHAYCQVVRELVKYTRDFRILALSATPGSDIKAVQQVLANLLISHIEIRTEDSIDIKQYSHERKVEKIVVPLGDELTLVKTKYLQILDVIVNRLKRFGAIYNRDTKSLSKFLILKAREAFRQNPPERVQRSQLGMIEGDFALAISLFHGLELLQLHGLRSLYNFLDGIVSGEKSNGRTRAELMKNQDFNCLMETLQEKFLPPELRPSQASQNKKKPFVTGHPKMEKLKEVVLEHFDKFEKDDGNKGRATRVMIFSQYRDSVTEIKDMLHQYSPVVKVMSFIGQSSAGKATKGFTQKEQLKVMKDFRDGGYNTLVSTCVGEEGLDIGEVDLIICFDAHKSPIRLVQRMGRTGRKREGRIVMLVTQGKEEQIYNQSQYSKKSIHKAILNGAKSLNFYQFNPRMVPDGWDPPCHKMFITVKETFKPVKRATDSDDKNKITNMFVTKSDKKAGTSADDGLLTEDQYKDLKQNYMIPNKELKTLKSKSTFLSLSSDQESSKDEDDGNNKFLSLSNWLPWQNRRQPAFEMGHSQRSKHLVELMEFIELQQNFDRNEDNYGMEMEIFLNEEDIIKPGSENEGGGKITNFFPSEGENISNVKTRTTKRVRRSDLLQDFESDKEQEDSDDDLPVVFGNKNINESKTVHKISEKCESEPDQSDKGVSKNKDQVSSEEKNSINGRNISRQSDIDVSDSGFKSGINRIKRKSTKHLKENRKLSSIISPVNRKQKGTILNKATRDKKKRISCANTSVVQIIADNDGNDFVDEIDGQLPDIPVAMDTEEISKNIENDEHSAQVEPIRKDNNHENEIVDMESDDCDKDDVEDSFSQLLPLITTNKQPARRKSRSDSDSSIDYRIPTPPSVQEIEGIVNSLEHHNTLSTLDLVQLVDEWGKEKLFSKKKNGSVSDIKTIGNNIVKIDQSTKVSVSVDSVRISPHESKNKNPRHRTDSLIIGESTELSKVDAIDMSKIGKVDEENNSLSKSKISVMTSKDKVCDEKSMAKLSADNDGDKLRKMSTDSDNDDDIFVDTQANFMLAESDSFLMDVNVGNNETKSSSSSGNESLKNDLNISKKKSDVNYSDINDSAGKICCSNVIDNVSAKKPTSLVRPLFKASQAVKRGDNSVVTASIGEPSDLNRHSLNNKTSTLKQKILCVSDDKPLKDEQLKTPDVAQTNIPSEDFVKPSKNSVCAKDIQSAKKMLNMSRQQTPGQTTNTSAALFDDSLFDDDILMAVVTPKVVVSQQNGANREGSSTSSKQKAGHEDGTESQFTFTQALACIHSSSEGSPSEDAHLQDKDINGGNNITVTKKPDVESDTVRMNLHSVLETEQIVNKTMGLNVTQAQPKTSESRGDNSEAKKSDVVQNDSEVDEEDDDDIDALPTFDLGFDIDEDIIPPSPNFSQSFSQKSFSKCLSQSMMRSRKSLSTKLSTSSVDYQGENDTVKNENVMHPILEEKDSLMDLSEHDYQNEDDQDISKEECVVRLDEDNSTSKKSSTVSNERESKFNMTSKQNFCVEESKNGEQVLEKQQDIEISIGLDANDFDNLDVGPSSPILSGKRASFHKSSPATPSADDSFVVRKKRRVTILDSPDTPQPGDESLDLVNHQPEFKTPSRPILSKNKARSKIRSLNDSEDFTDEFRVKNSKKLSVSFKSASVSTIIDGGDDDDDDFQDNENDLSKYDKKRMSRFPTNTKLVDQKKESKSKMSNKHFTEIKKRKSKSKSPADMFIVGEADVSDEEDVEVSEDEADDSDLDHMEDSFIHEGSQLTQDCTEDMHAVYLKSVKSPAVSRAGGKFRLQYNHANIDVFSQAHRGEDEEESQYIDDSFCVDDDYEETMVDIGEEVEPCNNLDETSYVGRKTRWSKPVKKTSKKIVKTDKKLKRIRTIVDSSSDEEMGNITTVSNKVLSPVSEESPESSTHVKPKKRQILSSSDDTKSSSVDSSPEAVLSLKSRIQNTRNSTSMSKVQNQRSENFKSKLTSGDDNASQEIMLSLKSRISKTKFTDIDSNTSRNRMNSVDVFTDIRSRNENKVTNLSIRKNENGDIVDKSKEERLRRQKEKQEEFRRKMAEKQNTLVNESHNSAIGINDKSNKLGNNVGLSSKNTDESTQSDSGFLLNVSSVQSRHSGKLVVLVDSKELNGAQEIVSDLRFTHSSVVVAAQFLGCDYVVSNRMGVDRKQWAEFSNGANRNKLIERIQHMCELYDRPCLLIERDRVKGDDKSGTRPLHWTKYVDRTLVQLVNSKVALYFTESQKETAAMLAELCKLEQRKNLSISVPTDLNPEKQSQVKFYCSFPNLSYIHALNLCYNYKSISEFLSSSVVTIGNKGKMSEQRATEVYNYIRRTFDTQMLPTSYG